MPLKWYPVVPGESGCKKAKGELQLAISLNLRHAVWLNPGAEMELKGGRVMLGMGWEMLPGGKAIDLDTSCVGVLLSFAALTAALCASSSLPSMSGRIPMS